MTGIIQTQRFNTTNDSALFTGVRQRVEVSTQHQWNGIGFTRDRGQFEAARGLVHYVLHLRQEHHGLNQLHIRVLWVPVHVGIGHKEQLLLHAMKGLSG